MSRILCQQCQRPIIACICNFICKIDNRILVLVLQHPTEVKQTKGTVALLRRSLSHCQVFVGEDFSQHDELNALIANYQVQLLYPSAKAKVLSLTNSEIENTHINRHEQSQKPKLLIILDGTWKKSYRMFKLSTNLQALEQVCLPDILANSGQYLIRKVAKKNALSSLEACCFALALLDNELFEYEPGEKKSNTMKLCVDCGIYQGLLDKFTQFNQFQLSFRTST